MIPFVKSGKLKVLAVATEKRTRLAPEYATMAEKVPGLFANSWYGLFAPAGTPQAVITRIVTESTKVLASPELQERLASQGAEAAPSTPEELARLLKDELVLWARIVKESGATID